MKRRAKGTGSVSERPDGKADAEFKFREWDGTLTRRRKRLPSKEAAEKWLVRVRYEHEQQMLPSAEAERLTLGDYLDSWLSDIEGTVSRHTHRDYADKVRLHITPVLGSTRLRDLTTGHLQKLYRRKLSEGLSPRSVRYIHVTLSKALHDAEGRDLVRKNVAKFAKPPKDEHSEKPVMSVTDAKRFLEAIRGDRFEALYLLAVTTGLRRGEILGLKWTDVDLEAGTLKVSRSLDSLYGPHQEVDPKRQASRRASKLPAPVVEALRRHRAAQEARRARLGPLWKGPEIDESYVFTTTVGTPERGDNVLSRGLKPLMKKAGLPPYNFQTIRRSNATFLVLLGVSPRVAMRWMGHSDVATTLKIYQQAPDELQESAAELMGKLLFAPKSDE
jgi:integrase